MTESEHTTAKLARALGGVPGVPETMIKRARDGYYHDFLSPLAMPEVQLVADLRELSTRPATPRASRPLLRDMAKAVIAVKACADLVGRTGAKGFECGYVHDDVPVAEAGWYATAVYKGAKLTAEDKASAAEACDALADRLLSGAQCRHCKGLVSLSPGGALAFRKAVLASGQRWDAEDAAKAPQCRWTRTGPRWERGCL